MVLPAVYTDLVEVTGVVNSPCRFLYKKETQQPSGSFKLRGMSKLIESSIKEAKLNNRTVHVFSSSGGNAGIAAAFASQYHKVPCTVTLPVTAKPFALERLRQLGAEVVVHGAHWGEADTYLKQGIMAKLPDLVEAVYCHPFDNATLWSGHADMVDEINDQLLEMNISQSKVKGIVCSCGGGGLYNGVVTGLRRNQELQNTPVLAVETHQTPSFKSAVDAGRIVTLSKIDTLSTSLAAPFISEQTLEFYNLHPTTVALIDDMEAVEATVLGKDIFDMVTEPACGATIAVSMNRADLLETFGQLRSDDVIIFIICGGSTVSPETMSFYRGLVAEKYNLV